MNPLATEIQQAISEIQESLDSGKSLNTEALQTLFLVSLAEEASRGES